VVFLGCGRISAARRNESEAAAVETLKDESIDSLRSGTTKTQADYLLIDKTGLVLASGYEPSLLGITAKGRVPVCRDGKCGYLNLQGNVAVALEYDLVGNFSGGLGRWSEFLK